MARRSHGSHNTHRRARATVPLGMVFGAMPGVLGAFGAFQRDGMIAGLAYATVAYTGLDPTTGRFNPGYLQFGLFPLIIGGLIHRFVGGTLGINRMLGAARVPLIRI